MGLARRRRRSTRAWKMSSVISSTAASGAVSPEGAEMSTVAATGRWSSMKAPILVCLSFFPGVDVIAMTAEVSGVPGARTTGLPKNASMASCFECRFAVRAASSEVTEESTTATATALGAASPEVTESATTTFGAALPEGAEEHDAPEEALKVRVV